jgi:methyl-accepting chemotaxis protein
MLDKMKIWQKLVLICAAFAVPLGWLVYEFVGSANFRRDFAQKEIQGDEYNRAVGHILKSALQTRTLAHRFAGDRSAGAQIVALQSQVEQAIGEIEALERKTGLGEAYGREFESTALFETVKSSWSRLRAAMPPAKAEVDAAAFDGFLDDVLALYSRVGDKSNLILDPDLDSYYMMDFTLLHFPTGVRQINDMLVATEGILGRKSIREEERADLAGRLAVLKANLEGAEYDFTVGFRENKYYAASTGILKPRLESPLKDFLAANRALLDAADRAVVHGSDFAAGAPEMLAAGERALEAYNRLFDATMPALDELLRVRIGDSDAKKWFTLASVSALLALTLGLVYWIARSITLPLRAGVSVAERMARGEVDARIAHTGDDEVGQLLGAMNRMMEYLDEMARVADTIAAGMLTADVRPRSAADRFGNAFKVMVDNLKQMATVADEIAAGNLTATVKPRSAADRFGNAFQLMLQNLRQTIETEQESRERIEKLVETIGETAGTLAAAASEILATTTEQAAGAEEQAAAVSETAATVDEVAQTSEQAAARAKGVGEAVRRAAEVGESGRKAVDGSIVSLRELREHVESTARNILALAEQAQAIGQIITTVNDIAEQTNLLALNAAIEASRAGEHGKGFAVVAGEVKELAHQSKQATVQVRQILGEIQKATHAAVTSSEVVTQGMGEAARVSGQVGETIGTLAETLADNARASAQISASASQQATGMSQIAKAIRNIDLVTKQSLAASRQSEEAARNLAALGEKLARLAEERGEKAGERPIARAA